MVELWLFHVGGVGLLTLRTGCHLEVVVPKVFESREAVHLHGGSEFIHGEGLNGSARLLMLVLSIDIPSTAAFFPT